jgi:4-hydroxybenzoyl-CoA thioesterase
VSQTVTIRFAHVDAAGIVFYARYFELLARVFPESALASPPFSMRSEFLRPNRLGDRVRVVCKRDEGQWCYSGQMDGVEHFRISSLPDGAPALAADAHQGETTALRTAPRIVGAWASDASGHMSLSRFFELVSDTIELWFEAALDLPFDKLHSATKIRVPTVRFTTRCRALPGSGDQIAMWLRPVRLGNKSLTFRSWLVRGDECLIDNEQVIVFVEANHNGYESIPVPEELRGRIEEQIGAAGSRAGIPDVAS